MKQQSQSCQKTGFSKILLEKGFLGRGKTNHFGLSFALRKAVRIRFVLTRSVNGKDPAVKGKVHCGFTLKQKTKRNP